jgi:transposase
MVSAATFLSDMTDQQWLLLAHLFPAAKPGGRPWSVDLRCILNGIFYLMRTGCAWRYLWRQSDWRPCGFLHAEKIGACS